mmetsp:Transcript_27447/g.64340  ORF Transcript_27447/g.64340 Transcript_27447/m.64340 type:complete len:320 (+) Transcript_27447:1452-2411(+)
MLRGGKGFHLTGVRNVRTTAQIDQITVSVNGGARSVGDLRGQDFDLEGVVFEQLEGLVFGHNHSLEFLLLLDDFLDFLLDGFVVVFFDCILAHVRIVIETTLQRRSDGELHPEQMLQGFSHHVRGGVPEDGLGILVVVELEELESLNRSYQRSGHVPKQGFHSGRSLIFSLLVVLQAQLVHFILERNGRHPVEHGVVIVRVFFVNDPCDGRRIGKALADGRGDVKRRGLVRHKGLSFLVFREDGSIGHGDGDFNGGPFVLEFFGSSFLDGLVDLHSVGQPRWVGSAFRKGIPSDELVFSLSRLHERTIGDDGAAALIDC